MTPTNFSTRRQQSLEDIAAKAGVSRSTVSRVINNAPNVNEKTRQHVLAVIAQEGFAPNPAARALVTQRNQAVGVVVPIAPLTFFEETFYFPTLLQGISRITSKHDYAMMLWLTQSEEDNQKFFRRITTNRLMDGVIIASAVYDEPLIEHFLEIGTPFVMVERPIRHLDRISYVSCDNVAAACEAVTHLIRLGRRRIGTITGNLHITDGIDRLHGYRQALRNSGIAEDESLIAPGNFSQRSGYEAAFHLLERGADAIFAASDIMARGAMQALYEQNVDVPEQIAIVGFDDLPTAMLVSPRLTTVRQPIEDKGVMAATILLELLDHPADQPRQEVLPTELIIRASCGAKTS